MATTPITPLNIPRLASIAPQFLVDDLERAISYYRNQLGFKTDYVYESFYASVSRDGCAFHLKAASKTLSDRTHRMQNEHLDAYLEVEDIDSLYHELQSRGAAILKPLAVRPWGTREFYVGDPDGYIICFGQPVAQQWETVGGGDRSAAEHSRRLQAILEFCSLPRQR